MEPDALRFFGPFFAAVVLRIIRLHHQNRRPWRTGGLGLIESKESIARQGNPKAPHHPRHRQKRTAVARNEKIGQRVDRRHAEANSIDTEQIRRLANQQNRRLGMAEIEPGQPGKQRAAQPFQRGPHSGDAENDPHIGLRTED